VPREEVVPSGIGVRDEQFHDLGTDPSTYRSSAR
jgi:hypothetical protein